MSDRIIRAIAANAQIRAFVATSRELVETARKAHDLSPVATAALGRLLTAGAMMGVTLKGEKDLLTLQVKGDGPMGGLTVTADSMGRVKGYANHPQVMLPPSKTGKLDVGGAVGKGFLQVIKDMGLKEPYLGKTDLQTGEMAEDLTYYFAASEQTPSSVGLGVLMERNNTVKCAGGFILQLMPSAEEETIEKLERNLGRFSSVTAVLEENSSPEHLLALLLEDLEPVITDTIEPLFSCNCSKKRVEKALLSIGKKELEDIIQEQETAEVKCHFCNTAYLFGKEELKALLRKAISVAETNKNT